MGSKALRVTGTVLSILILIGTAVGVWAAFNQRWINDQLTVWNYTPSVAIAEIAERTSLSDEGEFLFYASKPEVIGTQDFNDACQVHDDEEGYYVLGCYDGEGIYLFDITEERLDGMIEVTAAHEMLHAAWDRLSSDERQHISDLLEVEFAILAQDDAFAERIQWYAEREPGQRADELHSIIGTEVANLPDELESYYDQYFDDRSRVTTLNDQYTAVFDALLDELETRSDELDRRYEVINHDRKSYQANVADYNSDVSAFNNRSYYDAETYNHDRSALVSRGNSLEADRAALNKKIDKYRVLYQQYKALIKDIEALEQSIDSTLAPPPDEVAEDS